VKSTISWPGRSVVTLVFQSRSGAYGCIDHVRLPKDAASWTAGPLTSK
jgi:hypothetical protein